MTKEEEQQLYARVLEKNKGIEGLSANPDFQDWINLVPKAELDLITNKIQTIDRTLPEWKNTVVELVIEYQAIRRAIIDLTDLRIKAAQKARSSLKELEVK